MSLPDQVNSYILGLRGAPFVYLQSLRLHPDQKLLTEPAELFVFGGRLSMQVQVGLKSLSGYQKGIVLAVHGMHSQAWDVQELWQHDSVDYFDIKLTSAGWADPSSRAAVPILQRPPIWRANSDSEPVWPTMDHQMMVFVEQMEVPHCAAEPLKTFGGTYYFFAHRNTAGRLVFKLFCQSD